MSTSTQKLIRRLNLSLSQVERYTDYARSLGYTGSKPVVVYDGRVVSHGQKDWFEFCYDLRRKTLPPNSQTKGVMR